MKARRNSVADPPHWLPRAESGQKLDVRPLLAAGEDPLLKVLDLASMVPFGGFLVIEAPFNPVPLRGVLASQGYSSWGTRLGEGHWRIAFHRDGQATDGNDGGSAADTCGGAPSWREGDEVHIDVRGLEPPLPMLAILRLCRGLDDDSVVIVHHEREPHFLIPELAEIGWGIECIPGDADEVRLRVQRVRS